jgi:hypothetical protein
MTIPRINGWWDEIAPGALTLMKGIQKYKFPNWEREEKMRDAMATNPALMQQFVDLQSQNPELVTALGFGQMAKQFAKGNASLEQQTSSAAQQKIKDDPSAKQDLLSAKYGIRTDDKKKADALANTRSEQLVQLGDFQLTQAQIDADIAPLIAQGKMEEAQVAIQRLGRQRQAMQVVPQIRQRLTPGTTLFAAHRGGQITAEEMGMISADPEAMREYEQQAADYYKQRALQIDQQRVDLAAREADPSRIPERVAGQIAAQISAVVRAPFDVAKFIAYRTNRLSAAEVPEILAIEEQYYNSVSSDAKKAALKEFNRLVEPIRGQMKGKVTDDQKRFIIDEYNRISLEMLGDVMPASERPVLVPTKTGWGLWSGIAPRVGNAETGMRSVRTPSGEAIPVDQDPTFKIARATIINDLTSGRLTAEEIINDVSTSDLPDTYKTIILEEIQAGLGQSSKVTPTQSNTPSAKTAPPAVSVNTQPVPPTSTPAVINTPTVQPPGTGTVKKDEAVAVRERIAQIKNEIGSYGNPKGTIAQRELYQKNKARYDNLKTELDRLQLLNNWGLK